ncbi:MAG TPA: ATP-binding protein [Acidimicrobiales bacterium]
MSVLNKRALRELTSATPNWDMVYSHAAETVRASSRRADIVAIRLRKSPNDRLEYKFVVPKSAGRSLTRLEIYDESTGTTHPAHKSLLRNATVYERYDTSTEVTLEAVRSIMAAPIATDQDPPYGVLEVHSVHPSGLDRFCRTAAKRVAEQLGMFSFLAYRVEELQTTNAALEKTKREQANAVESLKHQLESPLVAARNWVEDTIDGMAHSLTSDDRHRLRVALSLTNKALWVARSLEIFAKLERNESLGEAAWEKVSADRFWSRIEGLARDQDITQSKAGRVRVLVDATTKRFLPNTFYIDFRYLDQAVMAVLDNACKYSFPDTTVRVHVERQTRKRPTFSVVVSNIGIRLEQREIPYCTMRGWRGNESYWHPGTGIGLWLASNAMQALSGRLVISPTSADDVTRVELMVGQPTQIPREAP